MPKFDSIFSIDCVIFGFDEGELKILLIERNVEPFKDWWALPGYLVEMKVSIMQLSGSYMNSLVLKESTWINSTPLVMLTGIRKGE